MKITRYKVSTVAVKAGVAKEKVRPNLLSRLPINAFRCCHRPVPRVTEKLLRCLIPAIASTSHSWSRVFINSTVLFACSSRILYRPRLLYLIYVVSPFLRGGGPTGGSYSGSTEREGW